MKRAVRSGGRAVGIVLPLVLALWWATAAAFGPFHPQGFVVATSRPESYMASPAHLTPVNVTGLVDASVSYAGGQSPAHTNQVDAPFPAVTESPISAPNQAILVVTIAADRATAKPGDTITYAVEVRNEGNIDVSGVVAESHIPAGTSASQSNDCISDGVPQPLCVGTTSHDDGDASTAHISRAFSRIAAGGVAVWRFTVVVNMSTVAGTIITNHAHAEAPDATRVTSESVAVRVR